MSNVAMKRDFKINQTDNLKVFLSCNIHLHGDEVLEVSLEKLGLHLQVCFRDASTKGSLPKELVKLTLCLAYQQRPR